MISFKKMFSRDIHQYIDPQAIALPMSAFDMRQKAAEDLRTINLNQAEPGVVVGPATDAIGMRGREWSYPPKAALITVADPSDYLNFHFNPPSIAHTLSTNWSEIMAPGYLRPLLQWTSGGPHNIPLRLFFLDFWRNGEDPLNVEESINWILDKMYPPEESLETKSPPLLTFAWSGRPLSPRRKGLATETFVLREAAVDRTQFDYELATIRASVDIILSEYIEGVL